MRLRLTSHQWFVTSWYSLFLTTLLSLSYGKGPCIIFVIGVITVRNEGYVFTRLSFCSQGGLPQCMLGYPSREARTPRGSTPPPPREAHTSSPGRRLLLRTVRILMECILVGNISASVFAFVFGSYEQAFGAMDNWSQTSCSKFASSILLGCPAHPTQCHVWFCELLLFNIYGHHSGIILLRIVHLIWCPSNFGKFYGRKTLLSNKYSIPGTAKLD